MTNLLGFSFVSAMSKQMWKCCASSPKTNENVPYHSAAHDFSVGEALIKSLATRQMIVNVGENFINLTSINNA